MKIDLSSELGRIATSAPARETEKAEKAARDFESVLLTSLFDSLQRTFAWDHEDSAPGASNYRLMANRAIADAVAANGAFGIGKFILSHLPLTKVPGAS
jgi:Rod binding domain-containing protein